MLFISLIVFACKKSNDAAGTKLLRTESTDNSGKIFHTGYGYDGDGRIVTITEYDNNAQPGVAVTVTQSC